MRLRPRGLWLMLAVAMLTAPGCFCCRPWGCWHHHCGYASPDPGVGPGALPVSGDVVVANVPARTATAESARP